MRGKIFRQQGSKLAGKHSRKHLNTITHSGSGFTNPMSGTITHRPLNPDLNGDFERFRISVKAFHKKQEKNHQLKKKVILNLLNLISSNNIYNQ
jgi:hypothetical protein